MNIQCSICLDLITGQNNENVSSSNCGHIFHQDCIVNWIQRSQTCPDCRGPLTDRMIFKLYLFTAERPPRSEHSDNLEMERLKESSRDVAEQNEKLKMKMKFLEWILEERTKAHDELLQRFDILEKNRDTVLNQKERQFIDYKIQSEQNIESLQCQIEYLQKENCTFRTKVKNMEYELEKKTETHNDLLQSCHSLKKTIEPLKSQIGNLRRENRSFRTKVGDLEWELEKKAKTLKDLLQEFTKLEETRENELNKKERRFIDFRIRSERSIASLRSQLNILQWENINFRTKVRELQEKDCQFINYKTASENRIRFLQEENDSLLREVRFLRIV